MAVLLTVPLKKPSDVDVVKPLINLIATTYSTADKPEDYTDQINEFGKLRSNSVWRVFEKFESSLEVIYGYYDQLNALESKIPPSDVQIPFKWKDAFNKGKLFGGIPNSLTLYSLAYEKVCVLFNIAALQSAIASSQCFQSDEGLKLATKLFQQSCGIFNYLKGTVIGILQVEPTIDLNPETLSALAALMLAQAQEMFINKAIHDRMNEAIIAKLSSQCDEYYMDALKQMQKESLRHVWDKDWLPMVAAKQAAYHGLADYYQSIVCKNTKAVGEEIARLVNAVNMLKTAQQRSGKAMMMEEHVTKAERALNEAKKDNDLIYHERIPTSVPPVPKAPVAKPFPIPQQFSNNFKDLFEDLVPMPVHQALAAYDVRRNELVNREINELRKSTQLLNGVLASLNLPAALEDSSGDEVPQSLVDKSSAIVGLGGVKRLEAMITDLPDLLKRNNDLLDEAERMMEEEEESDEQLREQFKNKWSRTPSKKLTETFKGNNSRYRELIHNAVIADQKVREQFESHKRVMEILSEGPDAVKHSLPTFEGNSGNTNSPASSRLSQLMEEVETMKAERDTIELELTSATTDMKETFLSALSHDGGISEAVMSTEALGKAYGPLQQQVKESITKQQALLAKIQETNMEFTSERSGGKGSKREEVLKELASAHDAFITLQGYLNEGMKFYNDLTQVLIGHQNKISDFCFARKTEKEELMKDLTQEMSRDTSTSVPKLPAYHGNTESKREVPARPPPPGSSGMLPPGSSATLPYPSRPQGMPVPYSVAPSVPYPTQPYFIPANPSFNPYATMAGYPSHPMLNSSIFQYGGLPPYGGTFMQPQQQQPQPPQQHQHQHQQQHQPGAPPPKQW